MMDATHRNTTISALIACAMYLFRLLRISTRRSYISFAGLDFFSRFWLAKVYVRVVYWLRVGHVSLHEH
jgi:hypothetical protein